MNKHDFVKAVAEATGESQTATKPLVEAVFDVMADTLINGEGIEMVGFGKFAVVDRAARVGRNPQNGEEMEIPARKAVKFTPYGALKDAVNK